MTFVKGNSDFTSCELHGGVMHCDGHLFVRNTSTSAEVTEPCRAAGLNLTSVSELLCKLPHVTTESCPVVNRRMWDMQKS